MDTNSELNDMTDLPDLPAKQSDLRDASIRFKNTADRLKKLTADKTSIGTNYSGYYSFLDNWVGLSIICVTIYHVSFVICETIVKLHQ